MNTKIKEPALCIKEESISLSDNTDKTDCLMCPVTTVDTINRQSLLLSKAFTSQALFKAFHDLKKSIRFKETVQKYELNAFRNISKFIIEYQNGTYTVHKGSEFNLSERGKIRHICATPIYDRVPIRSFCDNVFIPALRPYLIYDNCASLKGRGIDMQRNRMRVHLQKYFRQNKTNDGYILQGDFSKFFDNLDHDKIIKAISEKIKDTYSLEFIKMVLKSFCLDFSNCSDAEIEAYRNGTKIINSLYFRKANSNTTKTVHKGVEIGSEVSQIIGVFYPSCRLDNYIKIVKGCKFYGRYMDDFYIIHRDKVFLENILKDIQAISEQLGLHINFKKTHIKPLNRTFIFLKTKYTLTVTGKVVMSLCPDTFKREAIKLRKFKKLYLNKKLTLNIIISQYKSWRGSVTRKQFHNQKDVKQLDNLFFQLFNLKYEDLKKWQKQQTKTLKMSLQKSLTKNMQD
ncbi:MAG: RNA-directed DNA polymerase [Succinivibrio dextrinosolvens]|nr:RNA-directed DNA polymerase [Succinivibrio dextrinosolvens]